MVSRHAHGAASPARSDASQASASRDSSRAPREQTPAPLPPRALAGHRVGRGAGEQKGSGLCPGFSPQGTRWPWTCPPCITAARCCGTRRPCWGTASTGTSSGTARRSGGWASSDTTSQVGRRAARPRLQGARGRRVPVTEAAGREPGRFWVPWEPPLVAWGAPAPRPVSCWAAGAQARPEGPGGHGPRPGASQRPGLSRWPGDTADRLGGAERRPCQLCPERGLRVTRTSRASRPRRDPQAETSELAGHIVWALRGHRWRWWPLCQHQKQPWWPSVASRPALPHRVWGPGPAARRAVRRGGDSPPGSVPPSGWHARLGSLGPGSGSPRCRDAK